MMENYSVTQNYAACESTIYADICMGNMKLLKLLKPIIHHDTELFSKHKHSLWMRLNITIVKEIQHSTELMAFHQQQKICIVWQGT